MALSADTVVHGKERGAVLVAVLWLVTVMTLLVVSLGRDLRSNADFARFEIDLLKTEAVLDSAIDVAAAKLLAADKDTPLALNGHAELVVLGGASVEMRIFDASGLVDIAQADPDLLHEFFDRILGPGAGSDALAEAILTRRSEAAKNSAGDLPFQTVGEVYELASGNPQLVDSMMPLIGLYSKDGRVNARAAHLNVIESIPGISASDVDQIVALRSSNATNAAFETVVARYGKYLTIKPGDIYIVEAKIVGGVHFVTASSIRATIALDRESPDAPYQVVSLSW
jgi:type II secretory pathway component PulK